MTEPSGLEYAVRDRDGRIVVAWRPVDEVVAAADLLSDKTADWMWDGSSAYEPMSESRAAFRALLGLAGAADADR